MYNWYYFERKRGKKEKKMHMPCNYDSGGVPSNGGVGDCKRGNII